MPRKRVSIERKKQIMESLYKCLSKKQFHEITIKDIAKEAKMNHGMVYYLYKSKEDVLLNFIDYMTNQYQEDYIEHMKNTDKHPLKGKALLRHAMNFSNNRITLNKTVSKIYIEIWGIANHNTKVHKKLIYQYEKWVFFINEVLVNTGMPKNLAEKVSYAAVSFFEGNALLSILLDWKEERIRDILDEFQNRIIDMIDD